jgi:anti-sigma regulatory factor (Ser/Thr protein kinase)
MQASRATRAFSTGPRAPGDGPEPAHCRAPRPARAAGSRIAGAKHAYGAATVYLGRCEYPRAPESVAKARDTVRKALAEWGISALTDDVVLCVSEAVTNAVQHAHTPIRTVALVAWHSGSTLHVEVIDGDRHRPRRTVPPETWPAAAPGQGRLRDTGRGIFLISQLATRWGVAPRSPGKRVWFEFDTDPLRREPA